MTFDNRKRNERDSVFFSTDESVEQSIPEGLSVVGTKASHTNITPTIEERDRKKLILEDLIKMLPYDIQELVRRARVNEYDAIKALRDQANETARNQGNTDNYALDGYFLAYLYKFGFKRQCLQYITPTTTQKVIGGKRWKTEAEIFEYLLQRDLVPDDYQASLMPIPWLATQDNDELLTLYVEETCRQGKLNKSLGGQFTKHGVKKPSALCSGNYSDDRKWLNNDISWLLQHIDLLPEPDEQTIEHMIDLDFRHLNKKALGDDEQKWVIFVAYLQQNNPRVLCRYLERLIEKYKHDEISGEQWDCSKLSKKITNMKIPLTIHGQTENPKLNELCYYLGKNGNASQKEAAFYYLRRHDQYLLEQAKSVQNCRREIERKLSEPLVYLFAEVWPEYQRLLAMDYANAYIRWDGNEPNSSDISKLLGVFKNTKVLPECDNWQETDMREFWRIARSRPQSAGPG